MNKCLCCEKETNNPKFCSHSCSAKVGNIGVRRHGYPPRECLCCGKETKRSSSKYCSSKCSGEHRSKLSMEKIAETNMFPKLKGQFNSVLVKKYLIESIGNYCSVCHLSTWMDKELPLHVDHIDGNYENNTIENHRLICPNCHSQTSTYGGKNRGFGRKSRRDKYKKLSPQ